MVASDGRTIQEIPLRIGRIVVGRTPENDVQIDSRFISRHHCQVITTAHSCVIEDLNSTNGIYVKSARVRRHHLNDGDVVLIGKHELIYVDERTARGRGAFTEALPEGSAPSADSPSDRSPASDAAPASEPATADVTSRSHVARKRAALAAAAERSAAAEGSAVDDAAPTPLK